MNFDLSREWLVTNGIGGFASSTVIGCNTRRYHALLCAATRPPLGRMVLVNKADETLTVGARSFDLGSNQYPGTIQPAGFQYLREFHLDPLPRWIYEVPGATLERTLWMPHGQNRTVVRYRLLQGSAVLAVRPFVTGRDYHGIHRYNQTFNTAIERHEDSGTHITLRPYEGCPPIVGVTTGNGMKAAHGITRSSMRLNRNVASTLSKTPGAPARGCGDSTKRAPTRRGSSGPSRPA
jgi:glycogen debranching enzyme